MKIDEIIDSCPENLQKGLRWFNDNSGKTLQWTTQLDDGTRLFSTPKGIYKPVNSEYALSVRQTLKSAYPDREPIHRPDGTWTYMYYQEGDDLDGNDLFTNRALKRSMAEGIPIGVARQVSAKPNPTLYEILGIAKVTAWKDGFFKLDGYAPDGSILSKPLDGPLSIELDEISSTEKIETFDPKSQTDARNKILKEVVQRRGQRKFRARLLRIYGGRCAITGSNVEVILEAAHITPYLGVDTNAIDNGILLRADIHTLWDLGLIAIDPVKMKIWISPTLVGSEYQSYCGKEAYLPSEAIYRPSSLALQGQWNLAQGID